MNIKYIFFFICLLSTVKGFAQDSIPPGALQDSLTLAIDIFAEENPAEITLIYNMKEFRRMINTDKYQSAELIYHLGDSISDRHHTVRIAARGKNRREVCSFPPIWINIRKSGIQNRQLRDTKKIKLVTHCSNSRSNETYVLKEFLAYRIYNLISPYSFRVRLVRMKYIDTGRKYKEMESWAFLIEPETMLAERLDMLPIKNDFISIKQTDSLWTDHMSIFQFMIGNGDYSVTGRHNVKLLRYNDFSKSSIIPVPYDFDYAGIVDAHYAIPGDNLGISSVKERYFLGPCRELQDYEEVIGEIAAMKKGIYDIVNSFIYLSEGQRKSMIAYLDAFFKYSNDPRYIERHILSTCR